VYVCVWTRHVEEKRAAAEEKIVNAQEACRMNPVVNPDWIEICRRLADSECSESGFRAMTRNVLKSRTSRAGELP